MVYLGLALYAEGATDYRFLCPLLLRLCEDVCLQHARLPVDISAVLPLDDAHGMKGAPRGERIAHAARHAAGSWNVLFVHTDGSGDPELAARERCTPGIDLVQRSSLPRAEGVAVVPVRETEAWVLTDGDALRAVFGTTLGDAAMNLPASAAAAESVIDPKQRLDEVFSMTRPRGRRARTGSGALLNALGERVALTRLRRVPSFTKMEADLIVALQRLQVLR